MTTPSSVLRTSTHLDSNKSYKDAVCNNAQDWILHNLKNSPSLSVLEISKISAFPDQLYHQQLYLGTCA